MSKKENSIYIWKALAVVAALAYLYKIQKSNGGTLAGNSMGININGDGVIKLASHLLPEEHRENVRVYAKMIKDKFEESRRHV